MSPSNPFQIPSCFQASQQQRRRERFKKGVITAVALLIALLVGLLIQGCVSEHAQAAANPAAPQSDADSNAPSGQSPVIVQLKPSAVPAAAPVPAAPPVSTASPTAVSQPAATPYVVKRGDTLGRIAKTHGTTVKAIQIVNGLASDRIVIGEKLKMPQA